jgi:cytochrome bd-type quinol oxidase subunit 2
MLIFHILIETTTRGQTLQFQFGQSKTAICKFIAVLMYLSSLFYPSIITLHFVEILLSIKFDINKERQIRTWHRLAFFTSVATIVIGSGIKMLENNVETTVCEIQLNLAGKIIYIFCQGVLYICIIVTIFAVVRQMKQTRKAAGRKKGKYEKAVEMRFSLFIFLIAVAFVMHVLQEFDIIKNNTLHISLLHIHQTILPLAFPILFVLSTRQFHQTVKQLFQP